MAALSLPNPFHCHPSEVIASWVFKYTNGSQSAATAILKLLDVPYLLSLPLPNKASAIPAVPQNNHIRSLFYRHAAHILGWKTRHDFGEDFLAAVRQVWPDRKEDDTHILTSNNET
jgi:hypothetical protein